MTLFAQQPNNENNMITIGSCIQTKLGQWHPNFLNHNPNALLTGTVLKAVSKAMWDVFFDNGYHNPTVSFSSRLLMLVPNNILNKSYVKK